MNKFKNLISVLSIFLALIIALSASAFAVSSEEIIPEFTVTKISNPDSNYRMTDGLIDGGDRETSYAWCMAERGDAVYIGTNKNVVGSVVEQLTMTMTAAGVDKEMVYDLVDVVTNGEIPRPTSTEGGYILKYDKKAGTISKIYTAENGGAFRMAITYDNDVYFASYSANTSGSNDILRVDENDNIESVFSADQGTSMRAACIFDNDLYFGGVDSSIILEEGYEACRKIAIICKDENDDTVWNRVADYKDFDITYMTNAAVYGNVSSPIWDICSYDGYIYASIPNTRGFVMYKGHPADEGETANEYGWYWEEVIGDFNGINNTGLFEEGELDPLNAGLLSTTATPFVFNDELYLMDFDNTIYSELLAIAGMIQQVMGADVKASDYLRTMYTTLNHPQSIWRLDNETGVYEKVEGFSKFMDGTCNEYLWRTEVYDGELYITTMDSAVIYNYVTKLTNGSFAEMTPEEFEDQINYLKNFINKYLKTEDSEATEDEAVIIVAETASDMIEDLNNMDLTPENVLEYLSKYANFPELLNRIVENEIARAQAKIDAEQSAVDKIKAIKEKIDEIYNSIDWEGLEMYAYISDMVADDTWGFDLIKTSDGDNFEAVTIDGFNNKYNYGGRTLLTTKEGLYIGTSNPFYGAQLYLLSNNYYSEIGDVDQNGVVDIRDGAVIQLFSAGVTDSEGNEMIDINNKEQFHASDFNGDGIIDIIDSTLIQMSLASY